MGDLVSPGVQVKEKDLTASVRSEPTSIGATAITATAATIVATFIFIFDAKNGPKAKNTACLIKSSIPLDLGANASVYGTIYIYAAIHPVIHPKNFATFAIFHKNVHHLRTLHNLVIRLHVILSILTHD